MEIFVRILVRILDWLYGPRSSMQGTGVDPVTDALFRKYDEDAKDQNLQTTAEKFVPDAVPVAGTVNYNEMKWDAYSRVTETPEQFSFYNGQSLALILRRSQFRDHREVLTLRRMIRRYVPASELLND